MAELRLTGADDGTTVEAGLGDSVIIELVENPTTGYRWVETADAGPVAVLHASPFELPASLDEAAERRLGAGGVRRFEYLVQRAGTGRLVLEYLQDWGERPVAESFSLTIVAMD